jgi:hypothetical protein
MAGELKRLSSTDVLMPYRGWVYPGTSGVSQGERQTASYMYSDILATGSVGLGFIGFKGMCFFDLNDRMYFFNPNVGG